MKIINQRQFILADLKNKIKNTDDKTAEYKKKYQESLKTMSSLKDGISLILNKTGIDDQNKAMMDMIKNTGVTESNVMEILGVIEQKTNDLIAKYMAVSESAKEDEEMKENVLKKQQKEKNVSKQLDDKQAEAASLGIGIGAASLQPMVPTPASIFDDFSDEDDDNNDDENQMFNQA